MEVQRCVLSGSQCQRVLPCVASRFSLKQLSPLDGTQALLLIHSKVCDAAQHKDAPYMSTGTKPQGVNLP